MSSRIKNCGVISFLTALFALEIALCASKPDPCSIFLYRVTIPKDQTFGTVKGLKWKLCHVLSNAHNRSITSLDWSNDTDSNSNGNLVSCGQDCRILVWKFNPSLNQWTASNVFLEQATICFAALTCCWNPDGKSFVVGMGGKQKDACLEVCQYQEMTREWRGCPIGRRKIKSSILCVAFRPTCYGDVHVEGGETKSLVACGGCDYRCRIFCVSTQEEDFGNQLAEFNTNEGGWVTGVNWSDTGRTLAFTSQNCNLYIVDFSCIKSIRDNKVTPFVVSLQPCLPLCDLVFYGEYQIIVGGHDGKPLLLQLQEGQWHLSNESMVPSIIKQKKETIPPAGISCFKKMKWHADASGVSSTFLSASGADGSFTFYSLELLKDEN